VKSFNTEFTESTRAFSVKTCQAPSEHRRPAIQVRGSSRIPIRRMYLIAARWHGREFIPARRMMPPGKEKSGPAWPRSLRLYLRQRCENEVFRSAAQVGRGGRFRAGARASGSGGGEAGRPVGPRT
jgi:hypothetical protein